MKHIYLFVLFLAIWQGLGYFFGGEEYSFMKELPRNSLIAFFFVSVNYFLKKKKEEGQ